MLFSAASVHAAGCQSHWQARGSCSHVACMHRQARLKQRGSLSMGSAASQLSQTVHVMQSSTQGTCRARATSGSGFKNLSASFRMKSLSQRWQGRSDSQAPCVAHLQVRRRAGVECIVCM